MKPYYFGELDDSLFGIYHPPTSAGWRDRGVVLCYPYSNEYIRSHTAYARLTAMLNKAGFPVLRFDYYATGDSMGEDDEASIERWHHDMNMAIKELKNIAGVPAVTLVGLRFGASLIATLQDTPGKLDSIVLWDPIVHGRNYLETLNHLHQREFKDNVTIAERTELLGYPLTSKFKSSLLDMDLMKINQIAASKIYYVVSSNTGEHNDFRHHLENLKVRLTYECIESDWKWEQAEGPMFMPVEILQSITKYLSKESM